MGMPRGSKWKRLAVFSDLVNRGNAPEASHLLWANRIDYEWWKRTIPATEHMPIRTGPQAMGRADHPLSEEWLMVRRGDWPMAFVLVKELGVSL